MTEPTSRMGFADGLKTERRRPGRSALTNPHLIALLRRCGEIGRGQVTDDGTDVDENILLNADDCLGATISVLDGGCQVGMPREGEQNEWPPFLDNQVCYVAGQLVATVRGARPAECLEAGDVVLTQCGQREIVWTRQLVLDTIGDPASKTVSSIRVRAGAIAENLPYTDVLVAANHCLWIAGLLIPARHLVNGCTILPEPAASRPTYRHVLFDLSAHGELVTTFDRAAVVWQRLARRGRARVLRILVDGVFMEPIEARETTSSFIVPAGARTVQLVAHHIIRIIKIEIITQADVEAIPVDYPGLVDGWKPCEREGPIIWRAIDGLATLPIRERSGPIRVAIEYRHD